MLLCVIFVREAASFDVRCKLLKRHDLVFTDIHAVRRVIDKEYRHACVFERFADFCKALRQLSARRHDEVFVPAPKAPVVLFRRFQIIERHDVVGNLRVIARFCRLLRQHGA